MRWVAWIGFAMMALGARATSVMTVSACVEVSRSDLDRPACADYEWNTALIEAVQRNDDSALALLEMRYRVTCNFSERHRLGSFLLGRIDDGAIWRELAERAEVAVRFPHDANENYTEEFLAWCAERSVDPGNEWDTSLSALYAVSHDPRARKLLARALASSDRQLADIAIAGFATQRDPSALPLIEEALKRSADEASWLALTLRNYGSPEADAIAAKYLSEEHRLIYDEDR